MQKPKPNIPSNIKFNKKTQELLQSIKCQGVKKSSWKSACINKDCKENAIICDDANCNCLNKHQKCTFMDSNILITQAINKSKIKLKNQWFDFMYSEIQKLTQQVQALENRVLLSFLKNHESNFLFCLQSGDQNKIAELTGNQMWNISSELQQQISKGQVQDKAQKMWRCIPLEKIDNMVNGCVKIVERLKETKSWMFNFGLMKMREDARRDAYILSIRGSDVLTSIEQWKVLEGMFPVGKKPIGYKLLFKASDYNFELNENREKYYGIAHTVLLVKTKYGKIIGGYTPLKWKKPKRVYQVQYDLSGESFLFSISNNHKLTLKQPKKKPAVVNHLNNGPQFMGSFIIKNSSNTSHKFYNFYDFSFYVHPKYKANDIKSRLNFIGSLFGAFYTQQWQMHQVIFPQQE